MIKWFLDSQKVQEGQGNLSHHADQADQQYHADQLNLQDH